jgi:hypothetical protein
MHQSVADTSCAQGCRVPTSNSFLLQKNKPELNSQVGKKENVCPPFGVLTVLIDFKTNNIGKSD